METPFQHNIYKLFFFQNLGFLLYPPSLLKKKKKSIDFVVTDIQTHRASLSHENLGDDMHIFSISATPLVEILTVQLS